MNSLSEPPPLPPAPAPPAKRRHFSPRFWAAAVLVVLVSGLAWACFSGLHPPNWYPRCPVYSKIGLYCPGCGSARMFHALAHGEIAAAARFNILLVCLIPWFGLWGAVALFRGLVKNRPPTPVPMGVVLAVLAVSLVFGVLRNLPWWPFSLLAPGR